MLGLVGLPLQVFELDPGYASDPSLSCGVQSLEPNCSLQLMGSLQSLETWSGLILVWTELAPVLDFSPASVVWRSLCWT